MIAVREDFPLLTNSSVVYLDSAATSLKPRTVIDAISDYYTLYPVSVHRGLYPLTEKATELYEQTRADVAAFIGASTPDEIVFTKNATEALNLVASGVSSDATRERSGFVTTVLEHHANFVPWQQYAQHNSLQWGVIDCDETGKLALAVDHGAIQLDGIISKDTHLLALTYASNVLGTVQPVREIIRAARRIRPDIIIVLDAAQAVPHFKVDVQSLDCEALVFSGHKMCGPMGVGVLWAKESLLAKMRPFLYGGHMISSVALNETTFAPSPDKYEAGTPDAPAVIGLGAAIRYLNAIGMENIREHEIELTQYAIERLNAAFGSAITIAGEHAGERVGVVAWTLKDCHPHDIAGMLGEKDICIRAGHHCAMPLHTRLGLRSTARMSFYMYTTKEDIDTCISELTHIYEQLT